VIFVLCLLLLFLPEAASSGDRTDMPKLKFSAGSAEFIVILYDNATARDFLTLLPLILTFEDYAGTEKISYLQRKLSTENTPAGFDPSVGDLTLYAPWGNLAIFYKDSGYANGLVCLGHIESGVEKLAKMDGKFTVEIATTE
jgi:hypothetical protein